MSHRIECAFASVMRSSMLPSPESVSVHVHSDARTAWKSSPSRSVASLNWPSGDIAPTLTESVESVISIRT